ERLRQRFGVRGKRRAAGRPAGLGGAYSKGRRQDGARPRRHPGPSLPAAFPRHLDLDLHPRPRDRTRPLLPRRSQPPPAPPSHARQVCRQPRRALRRPRRHGPRRGSLLGRHRRHGRLEKKPRRGGEGYRGGDKDNAPCVERRTLAPVRRRVLLPRRHASWSTPRSPYRRLGRCLRAADARPDRASRRRVGPLARLLAPREATRDARAHRRSRRRSRSRARRDPPRLQRERHDRPRRRRPPRRSRLEVGRGADTPHPEARDGHLYLLALRGPRAPDPSLRERGRPRRPRSRRQGKSAERHESPV
ncbi:MAG: hypothetical protein AVDCRST_MAG78-2138, partial [uncultured Rubrobacteraceae bacterium]